MCYINFVKNKKKILVVDDESAVLNFIRVSLSMSGYEVVTTTNGEEALTLINSAKPDIMIVDVVMLPMTGLELLEKLRGFSDLPVIVFTARNDIASTAMKLGADGFIAKPFKPENLIKKINEVLGSSKTMG